MALKAHRSYTLNPDTIKKINEIYLQNKTKFKSESDLVDMILTTYVEQFKSESVTKQILENVSYSDYVLTYLKTTYLDVRIVMHWTEPNYKKAIEDLQDIMREKFNFNGDIRQVIKQQVVRWLDEVKKNEGI